ncbi:ribonuclease D [Tolumonas osonensis]|uniref:Ribonuclease D n=1 Tax=Tolumonas osonensis TaxID=675874 RepID=A0A841GHJ3_9GAMM|nr:ribonuclease D [Tolumonas osonensis]MBB6054815.1 ribonuclease D [Tolumonas osonensis]
MSYSYIDSDILLQPLLAEISSTPILLLDTEFIRVSTYFPKLGLLQIHINSVDYLIDPLAISSTQLLWDAIFSDNKLFVFHSCKEDLDVLQVCTKKLPGRIFDTQVAAAFLGYGASLGYAGLVEQVCSVPVAKDQTLTDWLARPLTDAQKFYAAKDVSYLESLYEHLSQDLDRTGKTAWFNEEMVSLLDAKQQTIISDDLFREISGAWQLYPSELAVLRELAKWRYQTAISEDRPQNFVLREEVLIELSRKRPQTPRELGQTEIAPQQKNRYATAILECIQKGMSCPAESQPERLKRMIDFPHYKHDFKQIKQRVDTAAKANHLPAELLGSRKLINQYLLWLYEGKNTDAEKPKLMSGWRNSLLAL